MLVLQIAGGILLAVAIIFIGAIVFGIFFD
jgi:hypothetical protein